MFHENVTVAFSKVKTAKGKNAIMFLCGVAVTWRIAAAAGDGAPRGVGAVRRAEPRRGGARRAARPRPATRPRGRGWRRRPRTSSAALGSSSPAHPAPPPRDAPTAAPTPSAPTVRGASGLDSLTKILFSNIFGNYPTFSLALLGALQRFLDRPSPLIELVWGGEV